MPAVPTIGLDSLDVNLLLSRNIPQGKIIDCNTWTAITIGTAIILPTSQACNKVLIIAGCDNKLEASVLIQMPNYDKTSSALYILKAGESIFINTTWEVLDTGQIIATCINYGQDSICSFIFFQ